MACFHGCFAGLTRRSDASNGAVATERPALRILTANDIYRPERFAMLHNLCQGLKDDAGTTKFVLPGDLLGGSLFANLHQGESVIDLLNAIQVDYCVLGNHEFDYGAERTKALMSLSRFPWLGSNVRTAEREQLQHLETQLLKAYEVDTGNSVALSDVFSGLHAAQANKARLSVAAQRSGTNQSQNSEVLPAGEGVSETRTPREAFPVGRALTSTERSFQVHDKCKKNEEDPTGRCRLVVRENVRSMCGPPQSIKWRYRQFV
eukprot:s211_g23.t1